MRFTKNYLIVVIILCFADLCCAIEKIETKIGPFDLAGPRMKESQLVSQFGQGWVQARRVGDKILEKKHIYYDQDGKIWVEIRLSHVLDEKLEHVVETILVSKHKLCDEKFKPTKPFSPLVTSRGIRIGDSIEKLIKAYGTPSISIEIGKDDRFSVLAEDLKFKKGQVLRYLTNRPKELIFAEFYFNGKGLHSLLISVSE
jgi:hypothetical protein